MRVVQATAFGGPEMLVASEVPTPVAGAGQAVVNVSVADVLFVETKIRQGWGREYFTVQPPYVPGGAVAGRVSSVGEGVDPSWVGRSVVSHTGGGGGYAEQVAVPAEALIALPDGLGLREGAALMHDGPTALGVFDGAGVKPGEWVLVTAAGGGMGILLLQLARAAGGRVIAAARGERKLDLARELGAEAVVDYSGPDWAAWMREATGGNGPDVVFDGAGGQIGRAAFEVTAPGGRFSAHGAASGSFAEIDPEEARRRGVRIRGIDHVQFAPADLKRLTERALAEAAAGRIRPVIGETFPLERAADAHAAIESRRVVGKTLLLV